MKFKALKPFKWLKNMKKYGIKITGDRTELIRRKNGSYIQRYKHNIKGWK